MHSRAKQLVLDLGHETSFAEEDFIVSDANRLAFDHVQAFPDWATSLTLMTGPAKSGKSHLAHIWARRADAESITSENLVEVSGHAEARPLLIDDIDRAGLDEHLLFHLLNQSMRDHRPLLMVARTPANEWPFDTDDVKSRARLAAHFTVEPADDTQLSQMFAKLLADRQLRVEPKTISYLVTRMERSHEEVVALTGLLDTLALTRGRAIGRSIAAEALAQRDQQRGLFPEADETRSED